MDGLSVDERLLLQRVHALGRRARGSRLTGLVCTSLALGSFCASLGFVLGAAIGLAPLVAASFALPGIVVGALRVGMRPKPDLLDCALALERAVTESLGIRAGIDTAYALVADSAQALTSGRSRFSLSASLLEAMARAANRACAKLPPERCLRFGPDRWMFGLSVVAILGALVVGQTAFDPGPVGANGQHLVRGLAPGHWTGRVAPRTAPEPQTSRARTAQVSRLAHTRTHGSTDDPPDGSGVSETAGTRGDGLTAVNDTAFKPTDPALADDLEGADPGRARSPSGAPRAPDGSDSASPSSLGMETGTAHERPGERQLQRLSRDAPQERPSYGALSAPVPDPFASKEKEQDDNALESFERAARGAPDAEALGAQPGERAAKSVQLNQSGRQNTEARGLSGCPTQVAERAPPATARADPTHSGGTRAPDEQRAPNHEHGPDQGAGAASFGAAPPHRSKRGSDFGGHPAEVVLRVGRGPSHREIIETSAREGFSFPDYARTFATYTAVIETTLTRDVVPPARRELVKRYFRLIRPRTP